MSYYKILGFQKEPFSTSPDPEFFYETKEHEYALTNIMIELRLKRGLSVILGDVGTGKTTLSRKLSQLLKERDDFILNVIMDPVCESENMFLKQLCRGFEIPVDILSTSTLELKEELQRFLLQKGIHDNKTVVLVVDEAQKLDDKSLEILRVLLNYETNEFKLLQLILFGQMEFYAKIISIPNFLDRISFKYVLNPLDEQETKELIEFRIRQAGYRANTSLFLDEALQEIYFYSRGYPRKIAMICHKALKQLVMKNRYVVERDIIQEIVNQEIKSGWLKNPADLLINK